MNALGQFVSALGLSLLILGFALVVLLLVPRQNAVTRVVLMASSAVLAWRYIAWRATETVQPLDWTLESAASWSFLTLEALNILSATTAGLFLSRTLNRSLEADRHQNWWGAAAPPRVDVYIATYNEHREVLERTIVGAQYIDYPAKTVFVLDDGRRDWLKAYCEANGVRYVTRPDNTHAKAGNINHALTLRASQADAPDFIAILDADFVPHRNFLTRALSLFHDPSVGLVQTPQYFFNPDPVQHNLAIAAAYPDEQRFFFGHVEPARDAWGAAVCCGTSSISRRTALTAIGGFPTESVTEDYLLTLRLAENGWRTIYLNEPLTEGLAPEGLQEFIVQRGRWCLGMMQIARGPYNPFSTRHKLPLIHRFGICDSLLYWVSTFPLRLMALIVPLLYWYLGIVVVNTTVPAVLSYFLPYYLAAIIALNWLSRGLIVPTINDVQQAIVAWPLTRAAWMGLVSKGPHKFRVTAKGGDRSQTIVQWPILLPFAAMFGLTLLGLFLSLLDDYTHVEDAGDGKIIIIFWSVYNLVVLGLAMMVCIERPRSGRTMRAPTEPATLILENGHEIAAWSTDLAIERARVRGPSGLSIGSRVWLGLSECGHIEARIAAEVPGGYVLDLAPTAKQRTAIFQRLHTQALVPGVERGSIAGISTGLLRLFISRSHRT
jgi:cellulose synthase (UDP-forming)